MIQTDLDKIRPGQLVVIRTFGLGACHLIRTVERLTSTQIVCADGIRYRRRDGRGVGRTDRILAGDSATAAVHALGVAP